MGVGAAGSGRAALRRPGSSLGACAHMRAQAVPAQGPMTPGFRYCCFHGVELPRWVGPWEFQQSRAAHQAQGGLLHPRVMRLPAPEPPAVAVAPPGAQPEDSTSLALGVSGSVRRGGMH